MNWRDEWTAISQRIRSLTEAGSVFAHLVTGDASDIFRGSKELRHQASEIFDRIVYFRKNFDHLLPRQARESLKRWEVDHAGIFSSRPPASGSGQDRAAVAAMLPFLAALESELTYHLVDSQELVRRRSERAFLHLQRLIAADPEVRQRWDEAFRQGEVQCEKLGAAHLLSHGIWAFKVDAAGARTDLVFPEKPLTEFLPQVERAAEGLVLTEWKVARKPNDVEKKFEKARQQADRYAGGALAGIELTSYRYAVVVSKRLEDPPEDIPGDGFTYRHINIAVDPQTPSRR